MKRTVIISLCVLAALAGAVRTASAQAPAPERQFPKFNPLVVENYGKNPMAKNFPIISLKDLKDAFDGKDGETTVASWANSLAVEGWFRAFYANLDKATLQRAPFGVVPFYGEGRGPNVNIAPAVLIRKPVLESQHGVGKGDPMYWRVPIADCMAIGVMSADGALFLDVSGCKVPSQAKKK
ncbi:MAG: hypothetical protein ABIT01_20355 [Thermoanaerobaculia bacterium]